MCSSSLYFLLHPMTTKFAAPVTHLEFSLFLLKIFVFPFYLVSMCCMQDHFVIVNFVVVSMLTVFPTWQVQAHIVKLRRQLNLMEGLTPLSKPTSGYDLWVTVHDSCWLFVEFISFHRLINFEDWFCMIVDVNMCLVLTRKTLSIVDCVESIYL